jgi:hopanoid biosynthesis associated RND transporter like protein HpnN
MKHAWAERWLGRLAGAISRRPGWFVYPQFLLFGLCVVYTVTHLGFNTSRSDLVGAEKRYHRNFLEYKEHFQNKDELVTIVESGDPEKNREFIERLGRRLQAEPELFRDVFFKGDFGSLGSKSLQLIKKMEDLQRLDDTLAESLPMIERFAQVTNLNAMVRSINHEFRLSGKSKKNEETRVEDHPLAKSLPLLTSLLNQARNSLLQAEPMVAPNVSSLMLGGVGSSGREYLQFDEGRLFLLTAQPVSDELEKPAVRRLRVLVADIRSKVPGVNVGITGKSVLEFDEMRQSRLDTTKATIVSLVVVTLIFIFGYQETGRPIKATLCLLIALGYTMGFTTLVVGHLNILTIAFVPMLVGLAIDFGVHLITRYEEELRLGHSNEESIRNALVYTGIGIFTGCLTTAGAFLAMGITEFKGIREMGIITGGGMLLSLIPMMTMLPALLLKGRQNVIDHDRAVFGETKRERLERIWLSRPKRVLGVGLGLCVLAAFQIPKVYFDYNLLNLQTHGLEAVQFEHKLIHSGEKSVLFGAVIADSVSEAVAMEERVRQLPSVASVESMASYVSAGNQEKLAVIQSIRERAASVNLPPVDQEPVDLEALNQGVSFLFSYVKLAIRSIEEKGKGEALKPKLMELASSIGQFQQIVRSLPESEARERLTRFQTGLFLSIHEMLDAIARQDTRSLLSLEDLPDALKHRFIGNDGRLLVQVYPRSNVWERAHQEVFLKELRSLDEDDDNDPIITGTPVQLYEYTELLKISYQEAALYALGAIVLLVLVHFRSLTTVFLALVPVFVGSIWLLGLMGWLGIPFNPANIMTLPLVIGIGVTNGIHILNRFHEEAHPSIFAKSTGKAVLVSALTTMAGFGSLMLAQHQGITSLGYVMSIGVATCMLAGLGFLPCLLMLRHRSSV